MNTCCRRKKEFHSQIYNPYSKLSRRSIATYLFYAYIQFPCPNLCAYGNDGLALLVINVLFFLEFSTKQEKLVTCQLESSEYNDSKNNA